MTYCLGILLRDGLVMLGDTRTNAGLDNIATFRKLTVFDRPGDRVVAIATAGNLATSQAVMTLVTEGLETQGEGGRNAPPETIFSVPTLFRAAQLVGRAVRHVHRIEERDPEQANGFDVTILVGGQVAGERLRLFMVYAPGNFIEATADTPYLQIGEHKYGKPILDRAVNAEMPLADALKIALLSMDSTMRSNLAVGMPLDLAIIRRDEIRASLSYRIVAGEPYFQNLRESWSSALRAAYQAIPPPPYESAPRG